MNEHFVYRDACEVCGSTSKTILVRQEFLFPSLWDFLERYYERRVDRRVLEGATYEVARCESCGFMWQTHILNDSLMNRLYEEWISAEGSRQRKQRADRGLYADYARDIYGIGYLIPRKPYETKVLDFGMGWGYWSLMAKAFGYEVCGLELSQDRIAFARASGIPVLSPQDLTPDRFDFINCEQVFEHLAHPLSTLRDLARTLKPGGVIKIAVPDAAPQIKALARADWRAASAFHPLEHINSFNRLTLRELGRRAGLTPIKRPPYIVLGRCSPAALLKTALVSLGFGYPTRQYFRKPG